MTLEEAEVYADRCEIEDRPFDFLSDKETTYPFDSYFGDGLSYGFGNFGNGAGTGTGQFAEGFGYGMGFDLAEGPDYGDFFGDGSGKPTDAGFDDP